MYEKQFEDFLTHKFIEWAKTELNTGYRYQFQSPDDKNSKRLFNSFINKANGTIVVKGTDLPYIQCGDIKLMPVVHCEQGNGFSENFISHLRDEVAGQQGLLLNTALLIIHNSMLDTLINSAQNVAELNQIWHPENIKQAMYGLIDPLDSSHKVSECLLDHRFNQIVEDGATMFGFEQLYKALLDGDLKFSELRLLDDPAVLTWDGKQEQIQKRLDENKQLFEKLEFITEHFPNELPEKLAQENFGEAFVKKHFEGENSDSWRETLDFGSCVQEQIKNQQNLLELEKESTSQGELLAKNKAESKAGKRDRHLILVLEPEQVDFSIEATFVGGKIEEKQFSIKHNKLDPLQITKVSKRTCIKVTGQYNNQAQYFSLVLKRDKTAECFNFRVLVIKQNEFYLDSFKHNYLIEPGKKRITLQTEDNNLQIAESGEKAVVNENGQVFDNQSINEVDFAQLANESDQLDFVVKGESTELCFNVEGAIATDGLSLPLMLDQDRFVRLYQDDYFGVFNRSKMKVQIDGKEVAPKGRRLTLLQWEAEILDKQLLSKKVNEDNNLCLNDIKGEFPALHTAYCELYEYLIKNKTLLSIHSWGPALQTIVEKLVTEYNKQLSLIDFDVMLSKSQRLLVNIGLASYKSTDLKEDEYLTPYHPMVLAYYLNLSQVIAADEQNSFKELPKVTIDRLNHQGLLPFVYQPIYDFCYNQVENENALWSQLVPQQETSYGYVRKLVRDKIGEFKNAFGALFNAGERSKLIINSVNNLKNHEVFLGLVDYVKKYKDKTCQIHVNLYDTKLTTCEFDRFSETASYDELKELYQLDKGAMREQADSIIDLLRTRITYSKFTHGDENQEQEYAHLSFFKNNQRVQATDVNVNEELSGVLCNGLLAGEAAANKEDSYFTAFGLKNVDISNSTHLQIAQKLSGLIKPTRKSNEQHSRSKAMALAVSDEFRSLLERSYQNSIWTTIIDPKVTLDFFQNSRDVVLIHYSDNYTNSVNYDAITVTKQTDLYKRVLEKEEGGHIEEFNAFNGEWLLKMITANANDRKEKKSIIGAYKFVNCLLAESDITWVPLSVAEMIRVTGNIGLKMSDSDFSRNVNGYKSGCISDDVLFVGFKDKQMYLLPLEVKVGVKQTHTKGVQQAKELKRYLSEDILGRNDLAGHLYRGLFIRQILMQIDKYKLYNLYQPNYFDSLLTNREWWLQGEYAISNIKDYPEGYMLAFFEDDGYSKEEFKVIDDILKITLPDGYLSNFIKTPLQALIADVKPEKLCHIPQEYILSGLTEPEEYTVKAQVQSEDHGALDNDSEPEFNKASIPDTHFVKSEVETTVETVISTEVETIQANIDNVAPVDSHTVKFDNEVIPPEAASLDKEKSKQESIKQVITEVTKFETPKAEITVKPLTDLEIKTLIAELNKKCKHKVNERIQRNIYNLIYSEEITDSQLQQQFNEQAEAYFRIQTIKNKIDILKYLQLSNQAKVLNPKNYALQLIYINNELKLETNKTESNQIANSASVNFEASKSADIEDKSKEVINSAEKPITTSKSQSFLTRTTLISDIRVPNDCKLLIHELEKQAKAPLTVIDILNISDTKIKLQQGLTITTSRSFKNFKVSLTNAINGFRDNTEIFLTTKEKLDIKNKALKEAKELIYRSNIKEMTIENDVKDNRMCKTVDRKGSIAGVPSLIASEISRWAKVAYYDDQEMYDIFIKEQTAAFLNLKDLKAPGIAAWTLDAIKERASEQFSEDFDAQLREVNRQLQSFTEVENIHLESTPEKLREFKQSAREEFPGNYKGQLRYIKHEIELFIKYNKLAEIEKAEALAAEQTELEKNELASQLNNTLKTANSSEDVTPESQVSTAQSEIIPAVNSESNALTKTDDLKVLIGHSVRDKSPILWEPTNTAKFMNTNSGIIGTMGTGKTQCTKSVVTQLYRNQHNNVDSKPIGILIFDYKSDYVDEKFLNATNGKKFNLHKLPYNPLSLFGDTPMLPVHTARGFSETMGKAFNLGTKQQLKLRKLIGEAYDLAGIKKADSSTWHKPAPTIADVWALFEESEPTEDSLYAALESLYELEIFEDDITKCTSLYELVDGITVVELAGYPSEIQNLVVALTLDLFYSQMQKQGKPSVQGDFRQVTKLLLVDEADNFMSQNFPSLRKVLKEGREYGVGVILSTQDITHFKTSENDYTAYILSWIVHRVGQIKNPDIKAIFNKDDKSEQENLMKSIRELEKHHSLYIDGDKRITKIKDKAFWELI